MTEMFRFMLARPAAKVSDSIIVAPQFKGRTFKEIRTIMSDQPNPSPLKFGSKISQLNALLPDALPATDKVQSAVLKVFSKEELSKTVSQDAWISDEHTLDLQLVKLFAFSRDLDGTGPELTRTRQLYDLVRQAANAPTRHTSTFSFLLKPLLLPMAQPEKQESDDDDRAQLELAPTNSQRFTDLTEILSVLNSELIFPFIDTSTPATNPSQFPLTEDWKSLVSSTAQTIITNEFPNVLTLFALQPRIVAALKKESANATVAPKSGLFTFGPGHIELTKPLINPTRQFTPETTKGWLPDFVPSVVKPAGVGDLLVVRSHVSRYEGGEIGNIQNVLKSEHIVRETKRLDRTEQVQVNSQSTEDEEERDASSTERFSLTRETGNVIKEDSNFKAGLSVSAKYGPTVEVKADTSIAENKTSEASTRVASQFSKDVTSRAASKVIQKTFSSTTTTTISQFEENFKHEFDNTGAGTSNIAGIYQWVNKVTESQIYNYGKRLLFDVVIPEPAAFLIGAVADAAPVVPKPVEFTLTSKDINETNYSQLSSLYQAVGITSPPPLLTSFSKAFKGDVNEQTHAGGFVLDLTIPDGYLAFAAFVSAKEAHFDLPGQSEFANLATSFPSGTSLLPLPFISKSLGGWVVMDHASTNVCASVQVFCIRSGGSYETWQHTTYDTIATAYAKLQTEYERAIAEAAVGSTTVVSGNNPDENTNIIRNELKKACITMLSSQSFDVFNAVQLDTTNNIIQTDVAKASVQGRYIQFLEQAFEWEELQYVLYPYYWSRKSTWKSRLLLPSPDPVFANFLKAGAARVSFGARLSFAPDVLYFLQTGIPWKGGPIAGLQSPEYISIANEIKGAEDQADKEALVGESWETSVPTSLVRLRDEDGTWTWKKNGPTWERDAVTGTWSEKS